MTHPDAEGMGKREKIRFARSELWLLLAIKAQQWAEDIDPDRLDPGRPVTPFETWPDADPFKEIATKYGLTKTDISRILVKQADMLEHRAEASGYAESLQLENIETRVLRH
jgi:hypothetical protein